MLVPLDFSFECTIQILLEKCVQFGGGLGLWLHPRGGLVGQVESGQNVYLNIHCFEHVQPWLFRVRIYKNQSCPRSAY
jgi:hypothetical protein